MNPSTGTTLVLGASSNPERYSHLALLLLKQAGIPVLALGSKQEIVEGITIHTRWSDLPAEPIDTITLYLGAERQVPYHSYILSAKPRRIIFNPGAENPMLEEMATAAGIETLQACTLVMLRINQY